MSRSRKKNPVIKDRNRGMKACANRKMRRQGTCVANGNAYRRLTCSYDICDWRFRHTYAEYSILKDMYRKEHENGVHRFPFDPTKDWSADMNHWDWHKTYKRK